MLEVRNISKKYRNTKVLKDISFLAEKGECIGIAGANGVGKSTLLKILAGGMKPDSGEIFLEGVSVSMEQLAKSIGYIPQENPLFEDLTVKDNLELWYGGDKKRIQEEMSNGVLRILGIHEFYKKKVSKLSGGMKKRLSIACAIVKEPEILILDEPGVALDLLAKSAIIDYMSEYAESGHCVIITSHELPELQICHRVYGMKEGVLEELKEEITGETLQEWMLH